MSGNTFGKCLSITTFGESHGNGLGVVVDGVPSGLNITQQDIQTLLDSRRPNNNPNVTPRNELDKVEILSGIYNNQTLGTPVALLVRNHDAHSKDYDDLKDIFRPSHADFTWSNKYKVHDHRGGGRSSARETLSRVAASAISNAILKKHSININGAIIQLYNQKIDRNNWNWNEVGNNHFYCPDHYMIPKWQSIIDKCKLNGNSVGIIAEIHITNMLVGIGEPVFNKITSILAHAITSIPAVKGIEFGLGFEFCNYMGSEVNDEIYFEHKNNTVKFKSNNSGGLLGGISNGDDIIIRYVVKPTSSIKSKQKTINNQNKEVSFQITGRHDPCAGLRSIPIAKAMASLSIADLILQQQLN